MTDIEKISNKILMLALENPNLKEYAKNVLSIIKPIFPSNTKNKVSLYYIPNPRTALLLAAEGYETNQIQSSSVLTNPDCLFLVAARSGEITILEQKKCSEKCTCIYKQKMYIIPLKKQNITAGILAFSFDENDLQNEERLKLLKNISNIIASTILSIRNYEYKAQLAAMVHENPNPLFECNENGEIVYANPAVKKILWQNSIEQEDLLPSNHIEYIRSCIKNHGTENLQTQVGENTFAWNYKYISDLKCIHIFGQDVSEQHRIESQLAHDAMHDALTDLPNRNHLLSILKSELQVSKKKSDYCFALVLIDLDRFKTVIESLGYSAGNIVLREIGSKLKKWNRCEKFVARLGGDEFAVILEEIDNISVAIEMAESIKRHISTPVAIRENNISLSVSMGITVGNKENQSPEEILQNASAAVYRAKRSGINQTEVFDKEMHLNALSKLRVHNELATAMETGELTVFYQPVFGLKDLRIRGFEALARWRHPTKGILGPHQFIPIAEETGLIHELGAYVLKTVCKQLAIWKKDKLPLAWLAVNVSAHQFKLEDLVSQIMKHITEAGADPRRLFVEITEGTAAESPERAFEMMTKLKSHGIRIALDDFGTGYSSMNYLKKFPIDTLKLDRSFIQGLPENHDDAAIATTVIAMAKSLNMKVVAEGVEHEKQAMFLRAQGCEEVQGFLYGKPMPAQNATNLLKAGPLKKICLLEKQIDSKFPDNKNARNSLHC
jgi:diguanylate cyclase (GGDEF)-like protein